MDENLQIPLFKLIKDGPIKVSGNFTLKSETNTMIETGAEILICRCKKSSKLPFCDNSHRKECD